MAVGNVLFKSGAKAAEEVIETVANKNYTLMSKSSFGKLKTARNIQRDKFHPKLASTPEQKNEYASIRSKMKPLETYANREKHMRNIVNSKNGREQFSNPLYQDVYNKKYDGYRLNNIEKQIKDPDKLLKHLNEKAGKDVTDLNRFQIQNLLNKSLHNSAMNPNIVDKFQRSKAPKAIVAGGMTAFMVSRMSDSKGQMSSSQLYGQTGGY